MNPLRSQRPRSLSIRHGHGLDTVSVPSLRIKRAQKKSQPAPDVQHAAFAAKALQKAGAMALVAHDPVFVRGFDATLAPILLRVIRLELFRRELGLRPDQATRGAAPKPKAHGRACPVYFFLEDGLRIQRTTERTRPNAARPASRSALRGNFRTCARSFSGIRAEIIANRKRLLRNHFLVCSAAKRNIPGQ